VGDDGSYTAITGPDGHYTMDYVLPGTHWLSATKPGYSSVTVSSLAITANVVNTQDFTISQLGQGADAILAATSDNSLVLTGPATAIPAGVVPVIRSASRTDAGLGTGGSGSLAVAGLYPAGTTFSESVTLTFHLDTAVAADKEVALWQLDSSDNWNPAGIAVSLSEDRKTASITIDSFNPQLYIHLVAGPRR
jgi:homoserine kinase